MKRTFTLFWLNGQAELIEGINIANAMNCAGWGAGALRALDFYDEGDKRHQWQWSKDQRSWKSIGS